MQSHREHEERNNKRSKTVLEVGWRQDAVAVKVYAEPFVGGGALLFHLISKGLRPERIVINDSNPELANVWRVVQRYSDTLVETLARLEADYLALAGEDAKRAFYLDIRSAFNEGRLADPLPDVPPL